MELEHFHNIMISIYCNILIMTDSDSFSNENHWGILLEIGPNTSTVLSFIAYCNMSSARLSLKVPHYSE